MMHVPQTVLATPRYIPMSNPRKDDELRARLRDIYSLKPNPQEVQECLGTVAIMFD